MPSSVRYLTCFPILLNQWLSAERPLSSLSYIPVIWAWGDIINQKGRDLDAGIMGRGELPFSQDTWRSICYLRFIVLFLWTLQYAGVL